jgi:cell division protein FtsL
MGILDLDIEKAYTLLLIGVFALISWFAVYVVYKLYQGQR